MAIPLPSYCTAEHNYLSSIFVPDVRSGCFHLLLGNDRSVAATILLKHKPKKVIDEVPPIFRRKDQAGFLNHKGDPRHQG